MSLYPFNDLTPDEHVQKVNAGLAQIEQKKPQIILQLEETQMTSDTVFNRAKELLARLAPVMTEAPLSGETDAGLQSTTPMGAYIENINQRLHSTNEVLAYIQANLQI